MIAPFGRDLIAPFGPNNIDHLIVSIVSDFFCVDLSTLVLV